MDDEFEFSPKQLNPQVNIKILYHLMIDFLTSDECLVGLTPNLRKLLKSQIQSNGEYSYDFFATLNFHRNENEGVDQSVEYYAEEIFDLLLQKFHPHGNKLSILEYNRLKRQCIQMNLVSHYNKTDNIHGVFKEVLLNKTVSLDLRLLAKLIKKLV